MRRLVYAADQLSKKDESIKSLSGYIHRLEQQTLSLRRTHTKSHARTARRCHSQDTRAVRNQAHSSDSATSSDCDPQRTCAPSAGSQLHPVATCAHKHHQSGLASTRTSSHLPLASEVNPQQPHAHSTLQQSGRFEHVPFASNSGEVDVDRPVHDGAHAAYESRPCVESTALRNSSSVLSREPPSDNSYALQLQQGGTGHAVQRSQGEPSWLTPTVAGELSVRAWHSPSIVSAPRSRDEICEQPSLDQFGGTFGTRPDFAAGELSELCCIFLACLCCCRSSVCRAWLPLHLPRFFLQSCFFSVEHVPSVAVNLLLLLTTLHPAGTPVRSTADSETWKTYMAAIDEMEERINALDFPPDVETNLMMLAI